MKPWAKLHDRCTECGTNERKHKGRGLCTLCHWKERYRTNPEFAAQVKQRASADLFNRYEERCAAIAAWRQANPEKVHAYQAKYRAQQRALTGVGHSAKWTPGKAVALDDLRIFGEVASKAYKVDKEWVVDLRLEGGDVIEAVPTKTVRRVA